MPTERWQRNLIALFVAQTMGMIAFSFVFPFFPLYIQFLGVRDVSAAAQWAGVIGAAAAISMAFTQPFWGSLADRYGRKPMVVRSLIGASLVTLGMGLVSSPEQLLVVRLIQGAVSGTIAASNALVATQTPKARLGFALGLMQVAMFAGSSVGPLIGGVLADRFGFRTAFYASSFLLMVGALMVAVTVKEGFVRPVASAKTGNAWTESRALLAIPLFPLLVGVIFMIQFGGIIITPVLSLFIANLNGGDNAATAAGTVLAATGAVSAASALYLGRVSDRIGHKVILPISLLGAAIFYFPQAMVQQVWQLLVLRMLMGVFLGGLMPSANALVAGLVPQARRGGAFGLTATASASANFIGPLSAAAIATYLNIRDVFLVTGVLFTLTAAWAFLGFRSHAAQQLRAAQDRPPVARQPVMEANGPPKSKVPGEPISLGQQEAARRPGDGRQGHGESADPDGRPAPQNGHIRGPIRREP